MKQPWIKFYPSDWRADPALRMCSLASRGLWIDLISLMHEGGPYGHLTLNGVQPDIAGIAALVGRPMPEVRKALIELESAGVFSRSESGVIFSRRMVRDRKKSEEGRQWAEQRWNNDQPNGQPNGHPNGCADGEPNGAPTALPNTQKPEARSQKLEKKNGASAPTLNGSEKAESENAETAYFDRGKQILGPKAGGLLVKLREAKDGSVPLARAAIEIASTKQNPTEYIGAIVRGKDNPHGGASHDGRL